MEFKRGEIFFADLGDCNIGSEQAGYRPVLIIQNNIGNRFSPTIIVACITSRMYKTAIPTHVLLESEKYGFQSDSIVLCEQIKTIAKSRLGKKIATLIPIDSERVDRALRLSIAL